MTINNKGVIAIDIDDTLGDFVGPMLSFYNEKYRTNFKPTDLRSYRFNELFGCPHIDEAVRRIDNFIHYGIKDLKPLPGAGEVIKKLSRKNNLVVVTSRPSNWEQVTIDWIDKNFPDCFSKIYFSHNHYTDLGKDKRKKHEICRDLQADLLIEDSIDYATHCAVQKDHIMRVFLYNQPWNKCDKLPERVERVHSWEEIGRKLLGERRDLC